MIKAGILNNRINEVKTNNLIKEEKMVTDSLNNLYISIERALIQKKIPPKFITVPMVLSEEMFSKLGEEYGYFIDLDVRKGHTRIFYNKKDYDNRLKVINFGSIIYEPYTARALAMAQCKCITNIEICPIEPIDILGKLNIIAQISSHKLNSRGM